MNSLLKPAAAALCAAVLSLPAAAQTFPLKTVRIIVPFAPGGGNDVLGRFFAKSMTDLGFDTNIWHGLFTTAGTPAPVIETLHREIINALKSPGVRNTMEDGGADPIGNTPAEFAVVLAKDVDKYGMLVKISGAKPD